MNLFEHTFIFENLYNNSVQFWLYGTVNSNITLVLNRDKIKTLYLKINFPLKIVF